VATEQGRPQSGDDLQNNRDNAIWNPRFFWIMPGGLDIGPAHGLLKKGDIMSFQIGAAPGNSGDSPFNCELSSFPTQAATKSDGV